MSLNGESTPPPPVIGKIGPYTVFMTPPSTPKPSSSSDPVALHSPKPINNAKIAPPPPQIHTPLPSSKTLSSDASVLGFFKNAVNKVQTAHSSLDDHLARWFGLNQSKYQWALDDYYETKGTEKGDQKVKEMSSKVQSV
ncbi:putative FAM177 family protein [Medicago truncatula]|uniref:Hydroxyproline-rich glycoprotein family protein n=1 Tax=Medicago truncatula TaxID=3880 RepID=B7FGS1_MEDTR|nr:uncharacterized protein LOC11441757 [Medicago truncatula]XP_024636851.1 uncharacterized protein LOC11441757 [Medicago truncatula]ACJ83950.1 unknown [Medicago truncatula]AES92285.1 hydroxyproline-rich glycoprotein family protein [Medicago truncatula]AFK43782.1 unknown [Medicago truncatula]RHN64724.1 putative FAM177 family protein [Medicago truncatula]